MLTDICDTYPVFHIRPFIVADQNRTDVYHRKMYHIAVFATGLPAMQPPSLRRGISTSPSTFEVTNGK